MCAVVVVAGVALAVVALAVAVMVVRGVRAGGRGVGGGGVGGAGKSRRSERELLHPLTNPLYSEKLFAHTSVDTAGSGESRQGL